MKYQGLELKLRKLVEKRLREGYCVRPGLATYSTGDGECCAVGVADPTLYWPWTSRVGVELGIDDDTVLAISDGFEGNTFPRSASMTEERAIGERIRRDYCEWQS